MGWYGSWAPYVPVAERRRRAVLAMEKRRKAGHAVAPVTLTGRTIAATFWGKAWCDNLESYRDFENRLPRGRTYVRNGSVIDLQIAPGRVTAIVCGSELYDVTITVKETPKAHWRSMCADCAGGIDSLVELLQGRFSKPVMERLCRQQAGLFPRPADIRFSCSCPDYAVMCKHVAAVLYGVGARLDRQPELLFRLRAVDHSELVAQAGAGVALPQPKPASGRVLQTDDIGALFGLDMATVEPRETRPRPAIATRPPAKAPPAIAAKKSKATRSSPAAPSAKPERSQAAAPAKQGSAASRSASRKAVPARSKPAEPPQAKAASAKPAKTRTARSTTRAASGAKPARVREREQKPVRWW